MDWLKDLKIYLTINISCLRPGFSSDWTLFHWYQRQAESSREEIGLALERENGLISTWRTKILPLDEKNAACLYQFCKKAG